MKIVQDEDGRDWILVELSRSSIGLKSDCDIEVLAGECSVRGAILYAAGNGVSGLYHYRRNDESIMDSMKAIKGTTAVVKLRYKTAPQKYRKPQMSVFLVKPSWDACADALLKKQRLAVIVVGPVSSGKSTFVNFVTNRVVCYGTGRRYRACAVMDLDPGQPLKSVSGVVSLSLHGEPDLGSDVHSHSQVLGKTSPRGSEKDYIVAIHKLLKLYHRYCALYNQQESQGLPLIINWHGWYTGMGSQLLDLVSAMMGVTDIVILRRRKKTVDHTQGTHHGGTGPEYTGPGNASGSGSASVGDESAVGAPYLCGNGLPGASFRPGSPHVLSPLLETLPDLSYVSLPYLRAPSASGKLPFDSHYIEGFDLPLESTSEALSPSGPRGQLFDATTASEIASTCNRNDITCNQNDITSSATPAVGVTAVEESVVRVRSSLDSLFRRRKRMHMVMYALFSKRICLAEVGCQRKDSYFLERLVCGSGSVLSLKNVQFVTDKEVAHKASSADTVTASFTGRVVYVMHQADHHDGQDWLVCLGVCTAIDWNKKTIAIYSKENLSQQKCYAIRCYP
ncbi:GRC3 protein [Gregarina niphandrodes]|uniref:GRC3 protein n=1 Tax=Gregarina niphandrodes TaxID=110365 RepID=A0A023B9K0_GRENI|nr:GRC3 protein [Gregarina niphandrodes]EZG72875.1 GRC3 protein [Gregarina niphandrodes]|eukprot:XP_011129734.1 GRC3 protein [Gregarina niphandrodes]